jgi:hypothetical protein
MLALIDATKKFISIDFYRKIRDNCTVDDIMKGDPNEDVIKDLMNQFSSYKEAIDIIDHVLNRKK